MIRAMVPKKKTEVNWIEMIQMVDTGEWEGWFKSVHKTYVFYGEKADEEQKEYDIFVKVIQNDDNNQIKIYDVCDFFKEVEWLQEFCGYTYTMKPISKWQTCSFPDAVRIYDAHGWIRDYENVEYNKTHNDMKELVDVIDWSNFCHGGWECKV